MLSNELIKCLQEVDNGLPPLLEGHQGMDNGLGPGGGSVLPPHLAASGRFPIIDLVLPSAISLDIRHGKSTQDHNTGNSKEVIP